MALYVAAQSRGCLSMCKTQRLSESTRVCFVSLNKATTPLEMRFFPLQVKQNNADTFGRAPFVVPCPQTLGNIGGRS